MSNSEMFTANEIMDILTEAGVGVSYESASESESNIAVIECEIGQVCFTCTLIFSEPFFEGCFLSASTYRSDNPFVFANQFSDALRIARGVVVLDEDGIMLVDEDGEVLVFANAQILFGGGISREHLRFLFEMWLEDLFDFYELGFEDEVATEVVSRAPDSSHETFKDLIVSCLTDGQSLSAREISRLLGVDRQSINPILYRERDMFARDDQQPPCWVLKR